jgi:hypothetical protein
MRWAAGFLTGLSYGAVVLLPAVLWLLAWYWGPE